MRRRNSFDAVAPFYHGIERLTFAGHLQRCRTAHLNRISMCQRILIVGEGDGRFLEALLHANSLAVVDCLDASRAMTTLARRRVGVNPRALFFTRDLRTEPLPGNCYDLIVTNFFLDCFSAEQLEGVIHKLAGVCRPGGFWLVGDFAPAGNARQRLILKVMHGFFRAVAGITARSLVDPSPLLMARGFRIVSETSRLNGFLCSRLWAAP